MLRFISFNYAIAIASDLDRNCSTSEYIAVLTGEAK